MQVPGGREVARVRLKKGEQLCGCAQDRPPAQLAFTWGWGAEEGPHAWLQGESTVKPGLPPHIPPLHATPEL